MKTIWIIIYTVGGIVEEPIIYYSKSEAIKQSKKLKAGEGLKDYDEIEIFEKRISIKK